MKNILGNKAVSGDNFHGREKFVRLLVGFLKVRGSFLILGLRRIGKSSAITEAMRLLKEQEKDVEVISINCQTYGSIEDFYKHIYLALPLSWQEQLKNLLKDSKKIPTKIIDIITDHVEEVGVSGVASVKLRNDVISYANPLREEITKFFEKQEKEIVLFVDELPFLFETIEKEQSSDTILEIEAILTTLRSWREVGVSLAMSGSLNLHLQLDRFGISHKLLAGLNSQQLPKYTKEEATGLLKKLADSYSTPLTDNHIEYMLNNIPDYIPQYLQVYFSSVKQFIGDDDFDINEIYDKYIYPMVEKDFVYQFDERWSKLTNSEQKIAGQILNIITKEAKIHESELLKTIQEENGYAVLLKLLTHEFIVKDDALKYSFSLILIQNWWTKKNL